MSKKVMRCVPESALDGLELGSTTYWNRRLALYLMAGRFLASCFTLDKDIEPRDKKIAAFICEHYDDLAKCNTGVVDDYVSLVPSFVDVFDTTEFADNLSAYASLILTQPEYKPLTFNFPVFHPKVQDKKKKERGPSRLRESSKVDNAAKPDAGLKAVESIYHLTFLSESEEKEEDTFASQGFTFFNAPQSYVPKVHPGFSTSAIFTDAAKNALHTGTYKFYVAIGDKATYYKWSDKKNKFDTCTAGDYDSFVQPSKPKRSRNPTIDAALAFYDSSESKSGKEPISSRSDKSEVTRSVGNTPRDSESPLHSDEQENYGNSGDLSPTYTPSSSVLPRNLRSRQAAPTKK